MASPEPDSLNYYGAESIDRTQQIRSPAELVFGKAQLFNFDGQNFCCSSTSTQERDSQRIPSNTLGPS